jgi:hypothetical protein
MNERIMSGAEGNTIPYKSLLDSASLLYFLYGTHTAPSQLAQSTC